MTLVRAFLLSCVVALVAMPASAYTFPTPKGFDNRVAFWKNVYAVWSVNQIAFHDDQDFDIVYRVVKVPARGKTVKGKTRKQAIKAAKEELVAALDRLDKKKPTSAKGLSGVDKDVFLALKNVKRKDKYKRKNHIRLQNGLRERFRHGWTQAGAFEGQVRAYLKKAGHPEDLVALAYVESLMTLKVRSHAGAQGIWQFMPATGREYMQINEVLDERNDPILATIAAGKYLNTALKKVGPWPVAITSYNYGRAGVRRLIKQAKSNDLAVILKKAKAKRFGFAGRNYYASFLAVTQVLKNPQAYFPGAKQIAPWSYDVVRLPKAVKATALTKKGAVNKADLKRLNPALRYDARRGKLTLPAGIPLRIPKGTSSTFMAKAGSLKGKSKKSKAPGSYKVRRGDSLYRVAQKFKVSRTALAQANGISRNAGLRRGQRLKIPGHKVRYSLLPEARGMAMPASVDTGVRLASSTSHAKKGEEVKVAMADATPAKKRRTRRHTKRKRAVDKAREQEHGRVKVTLVSSVAVMEPPSTELPAVDAMVGDLALPTVDVLTMAAPVEGVTPAHEVPDVSADAPDELPTS